MEPIRCGVLGPRFREDDGSGRGIVLLLLSSQKAKPAKQSMGKPCWWIASLPAFGDKLWRPMMENVYVAVRDRWYSHAKFVMPGAAIRCNAW
jgi:hypothetical protein